MMNTWNVIQLTFPKHLPLPGTVLGAEHGEVDDEQIPAGEACQVRNATSTQDEHTGVAGDHPVLLVEPPLQGPRVSEHLGFCCPHSESPGEQLESECHRVCILIYIWRGHL